MLAVDTSERTIIHRCTSFSGNAHKAKLTQQARQRPTKALALRFSGGLNFESEIVFWPHVM